MIANQSLQISDILIARARQLLRGLMERDQVVLGHAEASDFAADLISIAEAVMAEGKSAEVVDLTMRRKLHRALATPGGGDVA